MAEHPFDKVSRLEWLETNHTGAFAMGTVAGVNTRRYHGLLIATLKPPADRYCLFSRVEETVSFDGNSYALATVQYPGVVSPAGYELLDEFSAVPHPTWRLRCGSLSIEKSVRLLDGEQSVVISYRVSADCQIQIRPFVAFRDYHSLAHENNAFHSDLVEETGSFTIQPYPNLPPLHFHHNAARFERDGRWFLKHEYLREMERGLDFREDLYSPGILHFNLTSGGAIDLLATLETTTSVDKESAKSFAEPLTRALDQFRVMRADQKPTLIAGYPWFTDWSRDTLISLPALIASGFDSAETRSILEFLLAERKQGILPNRFSDAGSTPEYNTVDASLWFFVAAHVYISATKDLEFLERILFPAAIDIIGWHLRGTFYGIHVDPADHLLSAGEAGTQLTWMDAKIGDYVVTPRIGKPVEINALWFNALQITSQWAELLRLGNDSQRLQALASETQASFAPHFWNSARQCLYDVLTPRGPDPSFRPNQLFAISLPYPLLDRVRAQSIVQQVQATLLTPAGLRTLEPSDPKYRPRYDGDMQSRDSAYHQGTVWPWLVGPFVDAYLYAFDSSLEAKDYCRKVTDETMRLMNGYCVGSIGEVADAEQPHNPGGCPAQLWSVAQLILATQRLAK